MGYGKPSQAFVLGSVSLETDRDYLKPELDCPSVPVDDNYAFSWQANDYNNSAFYLEAGYSQSFGSGTVVRISDKQSPTEIAKNYKNLIGLESKASDKQLYARIYAKHALKGTVYSNTCLFKLKVPVAPAIDCTTKYIDINHIFTWNFWDYAKTDSLEFSSDAGFKNKFSATITRISSLPAQKYYQKLSGLKAKSIDGNVFARIVATDNYSRKTTSSTCKFTLID